MYERVDGRTRRLAIPPIGPFAPDIDVGTDAAGRAVAVYPRCARVDGFGRLRGCDLFAYDFGRRRERPLRHLNTRRGSELTASVWRGRVAFVRLTGSHVEDVRYRIYVGRLDRGGRLRRLRGGPRGVAFARTGKAAEIELRGDRVAYLWEHHVDTCPGPAPDPHIETFIVSTVYVEAPGTRPRALDTGCSSEFGPFHGLAWPAAGPTYVTELDVRQAVLPAGALRAAVDPLGYVTASSSTFYGFRSVGPIIDNAPRAEELVASVPVWAPIPVPPAP
jgi:hypothetical protein